MKNLSVLFALQKCNTFFYLPNILVKNIDLNQYFP